MVGGMATATATATKNLVEDGKAELVDVMCGDLFDQIDDLLDFPNDDDVLGMVDPHGGPAPAPAFAPLLLPPLQADGLLPGGGEGDSSNGSDHGADGVATAFHRKEDRLGPCDEFDVGELEWLSNFLDDDDSFILDFPKCAITTTIGTNDGNNSSSNTRKEEEDSFRSSSPVSVLEPDSLRIGGSSGGGGSSSSSPSSSSFSSSSCSGTGTGTGTGGGSSGARALEFPQVSHPKPILAVPARARSKRPRPATFSARPHVTIPSFPPSSGNIPVFSSSSDPESFGESPAPMKQKKKKKISVGTSATGGDEAPPVRKCMHCEIQKTPQWRAGPTGPKTLCNACGVRYKSGRLFPEYRPAASPTFVPSIHSNSHKKVVEMRIKASQRAAATGMPSPDTSARDSCDLLACIRRKE